MTSTKNSAAHADAERIRANGNGFRYSPRFIRGWTIALIAILIVFPVVGIALLASSDSPDPQPVGLALVIVGVAGPILVSAILGGNAIRRGGGWVGLVFTLGFAGVVAGPFMTDAAVPFGVAVTIIGTVMLVAGVAGFFVIGSKAGVPMWIQAPMLGSPRLYLSRGRTGRSRQGAHSAAGSDESDASDASSRSAEGDPPRDRA